ncbi:hypothetical protein [uncultured Aquimarina sp.]|uniref:hypothetical protein n=1 Tax=uncultured Aquimarina sp. TaxID=575652 RepID=UPI0026326F7F|nr:hypothetical protein [uncultured Aquimarina sp.]
MSVFNKIKDIINKRKALYNLYSDIRNLDEVKLEKRIEIFEEIVTPRFAQIGLNNWNGKYLWYSDFNDQGIKHVIQFHKFKGFSGKFSFGNCFDFVPTISGKKLINHRTDKSTKVIYLKTLEKSVGDNSNLISTLNEQKFRGSLDKVLSKNINNFESWFLSNSTIQENISGLKVDIQNHPAIIGEMIISYEYIISFLYRQEKDFDSCNYWINKHFEKNLNSEIEKELILKKIKN